MKWSTMDSGAIIELDEDTGSEASLNNFSSSFWDDDAYGGNYACDGANNVASLNWSAFNSRYC